MGESARTRQTLLGAVALALGLGALASQLVVRQLASEAETRGRLELARSLERVVAQIADQTSAGPAIGGALVLGLTDAELKAALRSGRPPNAAAVLERLRPLRREFGADHVFLFDRDGRVVADETLQLRLTGTSVAKLPLFARAMHGQPSVFASASDAGLRTLYLAAPIRAGDTRFTPAIGGVVIRISAEPLDFTLEELAADGMLIAPDGTVFAATRAEWRFLRAPGQAGDPGAAAFAAIRQRQGDALLPFDVAQPVVSLGGARYALERQAFDWNDADGPWQVVALRDMAEWFPERRRLTVSLLVFAASAVLGLLAVATVVYRRKLNAQRAALREQQDRLAAARASELALEARVAERTLELAATVERLQRTQRELVEAEKLASLGALVAGVAHELNTPIGNALTAATTLEDRAQRLRQQACEGHLRRTMLDEFLAACVALCELLTRSCQRAATLIRDFKEIAVDRSSEELREFDLRELFERNLAALRGSLQAARWRIALDIADGLRCRTYPSALGQIIAHLVQNAGMHAFGDGREGCLLIAARCEGDCITIDFCDDGNGMSEDILAHAFEPFFTTKLGMGGSGLGLAICRNIATGLLGGSLAVAANPSAGVCFTLRFPSQAAIVEPPQAHGAGAEVPGVR